MTITNSKTKETLECTVDLKDIIDKANILDPMTAVFERQFNIDCNQTELFKLQNIIEEETKNQVKEVGNLLGGSVDTKKVKLSNIQIKRVYIPALGNIIINES